MGTSRTLLVPGSYPWPILSPNQVTKHTRARAYACHGFPSASFHAPSTVPPPLISSATALQARTERERERERAPMASSLTTSRLTFTFPHPPVLQSTIKPSKACNFPTLNLKKPHLFSFKPTAISSVDVSNEDKPLSEPESLDKEEEKEKEKEEEQIRNLDPRRFEEKFAVLNTGIYECRSCGYRYDEAAGDPSYPIPPGFQFGKLPEDWRCPTCGAAKSFFESKSIEIAGFAQNQQFGLGANTLTSGQKAVLIYGGLLLGFIFFLSGYFLQ